MGEPIDELVAISRRYGSDPAFVLAGGGNTSFKTDDRLFVKASGHALATIGADGFVELDRGRLAELLDAELPGEPEAREAAFVERVMAARVYPDKEQRPSVEALLHHLMPQPFVVHTHATKVNAVTCCVRGEAIAQDLFGSRVVWQPYVDPGFILAGALQASLAKQPGADAIFLENHGLIVAGDSAASIDRITRDVIAPLDDVLPTPAEPNELDAAKLTDAAKAAEAFDPAFRVVTDASPVIARLVTNQRLTEAALAGALTPDQIVYCRAVPMWLEVADDFAKAHADYVARTGFEPWAALVAGAGLVAFRETDKLAATTRDLWLDAAAILYDADALGGVRHMSEAHQRFIETWEVESYRRNVAAG
ncbi:MAG: class II aldolase/adducin family protein [Planctomycetota bacterium]